MRSASAKVKNILNHLIFLFLVSGLLFFSWSPALQDTPLKFTMENVPEAQAAHDPVVGIFPASYWSSTGDSDLALTYPDPQDGDLMVASIAIRPSTSTVNTPSGWSSAGSWTANDGGSEGEDTGSVRYYWFYKVADGTEGLGTQTFTESGTTSVWGGSIARARSATGTYDVSAGGYSKNSDTTTWNGTLDTDIGLTEDDAVLFAAAQNGDLSNTSGWNFSATGINLKSTVNEHREFSTDTGNDLEIGVASNLVWSGTSSTTPTISLAQSSAVSGVISALRIRQGAGDNRSDLWIRGMGPSVTGTTSLSIPYPEHEVGDMLVLFIGHRPSGSIQVDGWTHLASGGYGNGLGEDSGSSQTTIHYQEVSAIKTGTYNITLNSSNPNTAVGQIMAVHRDYADEWSFAGGFGGHWQISTTWQLNYWGAPGTGAVGDLFLAMSSINTDEYTYSNHAFSQGGFTFGEVTQDTIRRSDVGNDMTLEVVSSRITAGSGSVQPTFTSTATGYVSNQAPSGSGAQILIKATATDPPSVSVSITSDGVIAFGSVGLGDTISTLDLSDTQTLQYDGDSGATINIKTTKTQDWFFGGSVGYKSYIQEFSTNAGTNWTSFADADTYYTLAEDVNDSDTIDFDIRLQVPTEVDNTNEQTFTVTVQAVEP